MFGKLKDFVKDHQGDIILLLGVILISLLSFAVGYIVAKEQQKEPIEINESRINYEYTNSYIGTDSLSADLI